MDSRTVTGALNFAADHTNGGIWSNTDRSRTTQALKSAQVTLENARYLTSAPSLEREGFQTAHLPMHMADWTNAEWVANTYLPQSMELVRGLTGAKHVAPFFRNGVLIRDTGNTTRAPAAEFVHIDQTAESARPFLEAAVDEKILQSYSRIKIFNIWRPITPPPQDVPLAICDQRTLDRNDLVTGYTVEPNFPDGVAYLTSVFNPAQKWYYISDLTEDDAVLFKGYDSDSTQPVGCLHGAFRQPVPPPGAVPRASVEFRVFAFFDA